MPVVSLPLTQYQAFVNRWHNCRACDLSETRTYLALDRGKKPCDVMYLGEAPGHSEDLIGRPFVGPAGNLANWINEQALGNITVCPNCRPALVRECKQGHGRPPEPLRIAWTNLVCCIPLDEDGKKTAEPLDEHVKACAPRLQEFVRIADPKLIITLGNPARDWIDWRRKGYIKFHREIPTVACVHPAHILRKEVPEARRRGMMKRSVVVIRNAVLEMLDAGRA